MSDIVDALRLAGVTREYPLGGQTVRALDEFSLRVPRGEFIAIVGRSGSGKSTLLNLAAGIDTPTRGEVWVDGRALRELSDDDRTRLRRDRIGMIYQFFNLLSTLDVRENVALPALLGGRPAREVFARADQLLAELGMAARARARPHTLSGGELQRAAIARALIGEPALILADEPTGNLDSRAAASVIEAIAAAGRRHGVTVVLVTHSPEAASAADRVVELRDGRIRSDEPRP